MRSKSKIRALERAYWHPEREALGLVAAGATDFAKFRCERPTTPPTCGMGRLEAKAPRPARGRCRGGGKPRRKIGTRIGTQRSITRRDRPGQERGLSAQKVRFPAENGTGCDEAIRVPPHLKTGRRESVSWVRIPPHPPRFKTLILRCFSGFRRCGIRDSSRGFRACVHRPRGPVRQPSPVCGPPIPRISLSAV